MATELYKINFTRFQSQKFKDRTQITPNVPFLHDLSDKYLHFTPEVVFEDEKTFVDNFANPLYSVIREYAMVVVEENGDKISLKMFYGHKQRKVGRSYFQKKKHLEYFTINKRTGDIYVGYIHNFQNKRNFQKGIRKNYFQNEPVQSFILKIKGILSVHTKKSSEIALDIMENFLKDISYQNNFLSNDSRLLKFYLEKKGMKYPNNFWVFAKHMTGPLYRKALKKNGKKIVDTFMFLWGIKGKKVKKYLHEVKDVNYNLFLSARELFGEDWLNQDSDFIKEIFESENTTINVPKEFKEFLSQEELKRVYSVFKNVVSSKNIDVWSFNDHAMMYCRLKNFGETDIKWNCDGSDYKKFTEEHLDFTDKLEHYKKGTYKRIYPEYFIQKLETEIDGYHSYLLKSSNDYNEESFHQHNCVKTYIGKANSFIVSLRKDSLDSLNRATIEYKLNYRSSSNSVFAQRVQTLGKYNSGLDSSWDNVLLKLDEIVISSVEDKKFESVKITKTCSNGITLFSDSHFNDDGFLCWSNQQPGISYELW